MAVRDVRARYARHRRRIVYIYLPSTDIHRAHPQSYTTISTKVLVADNLNPCVFSVGLDHSTDAIIVRVSYR